MNNRYLISIMLITPLLAVCDSQSLRSSAQPEQSSSIPTMPLFNEQASLHDITSLRGTTAGQAAEQAAASRHGKQPPKPPQSEQPPLASTRQALFGTNDQVPTAEKPQEASPDQEETVKKGKELDFDVENQTGKTLYITSFAYLRRVPLSHWHWSKSPIYTLQPGKTVTVAIGNVPDSQDRDDVFGYLAVMDSKQAAEEATLELLADKHKLDLDQLIKLQGKKVTIQVEQYGFKGNFYEYDFVDKNGSEVNKVPDLTFAVENKTGKPVLVSCFVYDKRAKGSWVAADEKKDDMTTWHFEKTPVIRLEPGQTGMVDIGPLMTKRDSANIYGFLGVFDEHQVNLAKDVTYELLLPEQKLAIGHLGDLKNKKIVLEIEKYGTMQSFIDYVVKPARRIDFTDIKRDR